ncbi:hypothetical protein [Salinibacter ruber]|uniref:hypothetical protein n=1 Tax=Salinibacter ruber TaxID=146919 RepID=UPI002169443F|nr:hypothetical protein [Salinibacter ruber]MCS4142541.1 hypothetical protein [Salinibacter ruber]
MNLRPSIRRSLGKGRNLLSHLEEKVTDQKWIFLHLPKCGGTSVAAGLQRALGAGPEGFIDPVQTREWAQRDLPKTDRAEGSARLFRLRLTLLREYADRGHPLIFGYFPLDEHLFSEGSTEYCWLTVLRAPAERVLSQFTYGLLTREQSVAASVTAVKKQWQSFLGSDYFQFHANLYAYYLGGHAVGFDRSRVDEMRSCAKANLRKFDVYGRLENLPDVASDFRSLTGFDVEFRRLNSSQVNSDTQEQMRVIEQFEKSIDREELRERTQGDVEIYNLARG